MVLPLVGAHTAHFENSGQPCNFDNPQWREDLNIDGVDVEADPSCEPDNPYVVASVVKGTNKVSKNTLMDSGLSKDAVVKGEDVDGDGDPDKINITLEVIGLNEGRNQSLPYAIAPGIQPSFWTFAPKTRGMASEGAASGLLRMPAPSIRVEKGDDINVILENTHYMPHTIHLHGVDHEFLDKMGEGNDGVPHASENPLLPGERRVYDIKPRVTGTNFYHCHVQPDTHVLMGLQGMFIVEENLNNNTLQTLNPGAGKVRHDRGRLSEYDLHYQGVDKELHEIPKSSNDAAVIARKINREYDVTERTSDYFLLNGRSFPYTLRESQVIVEPNKSYRLRVLNGGSETISLHTHGHKFLVDSLDGVELEDKYYRDVLGLTAAQRADIILNTTNDGLNSYDEGVWFMHDHREQGVTNDGMSPGGTVSLITYEKFLKPNGMPTTFGVGLDKLFNESFYEREIPVWEEYSGGMFEERKDSNLEVLFLLLGLIFGTAIGLEWYYEN